MLCASNPRPDLLSSPARLSRRNDGNEWLSLKIAETLIDRVVFAAGFESRAGINIGAFPGSKCSLSREYLIIYYIPKVLKYL